MRTYQQLMELAAKASGIDPDRIDSSQRENGPNPYIVPWNPLADDGDALRLAVSLGMKICINNKTGFSWVKGIQGSIPHQGDPNAATRSAIVHAAAYICK